jgi:hypothetical protein
MLDNGVPEANEKTQIFPLSSAHRALEELLGEEFECEKELTYVGSNGIPIKLTPDAIQK